ncbi:hypothetical protein F4801DRAFT_576455 [Xylaria longipes]|nr:hypothetical protein F4801DRAFT_576455 [Xylaria longipes]
MSSLTSSRATCLPYDPVRSPLVGEAPTTYTYPSPIRFVDASITFEPSRFPLSEIRNEYDFTEGIRQQAMMAQMDWSARPGASPTHSQAQTEILVQDALDDARNYTHGHPENVLHYHGDDFYGNGIDPRYEQESVPPNHLDDYIHVHIDENVPYHPHNDVYYDDIDPHHDQENIPPNSDYTHVHIDENVPHYDGNDVYNNDIAPLYDQENVPPNYGANYIPSQAEDNFLIPAGNDAYGNDIASIHEQEYVLPNHAGNYQYGDIIYPLQIAPLQESLLNSAPTIFSPSPQQATFPLQERYPVEPLNSPEPFHLPEPVYSPITELNREMALGKRIWEDDDDPSFHTMRPAKIARRESPEIKIEPVEDEDYYSPYAGFHGSSYAPRPQEPEIRESIETDEEYHPRETIEHTKREPVEDTDSSSLSSRGTYRSSKFMAKPHLYHDGYSWRFGPKRPTEEWVRRYCEKHGLTPSSLREGTSSHGSTDGYSTPASSLTSYNPKDDVTKREF